MNKYMKYDEFYKMIAESLGQTKTTIVTVPVNQLKPSALEMDKRVAAKGKELAINLGKQIEMQNREAFIDPKETMPIIKYQEDDVRAEIRKTLAVGAEEVQ